MSKLETTVVKLAEFAATGPVMKRLEELGLRVHFAELEDHNTSLDGYLVNPYAFCIMMSADQRFKRDIWNFLHPEIEEPTGFREYKVPGRRGSMQIVTGRDPKTKRLGKTHVDIDGHNTQDVVNIVAHIVADVIFKHRA